MGGFSSRPQLLSRGGPSVKAEALSPVPQGVGGSRLGPARSGSVVKTAGPPGTELPVGDSSSDSPDDYAMGDAAVEAESHVVTRASSGNVFSTTSAHASAAVPGRHTGHLTAAERRESNHYGGGVSDIGASSTISTSHVVRGRPLTSGTATMGDASGARSGTGVVQERKFVGAYSPEARRQRIQRFLEKREHRVSIGFVGLVCVYETCPLLDPLPCVFNLRCWVADFLAHGPFGIRWLYVHSLSSAGSRQARY